MTDRRAGVTRAMLLGGNADYVVADVNQASAGFAGESFARAFRLVSEPRHLLMIEGRPGGRVRSPFPSPTRR